YPQKNGHFLSGEFSVCASHRVLAFPATDDPQQPRQWPNPPPRLAPHEPAPTVTPDKCRVC
ncbi:hypothetical protein, partial [Mobiluncus mulieris]|uniref:hypothetical protein n=1 Tax=Mobiluncus mulieris TaxID=2052 RepID=UPI0021E2D35A